MNSFKRISFAILTACFVATVVQAQTLTRAQEGLRTKNVQLLAITGATIIPEPGKILNNATIIIRNGRIDAVGTNISIPAGADIRNGNGLWIYPAFVEVYSDAGIPKQVRSGNRGEEGQNQQANSRGARHWNESIRPEQNAADMISLDEKTADDFKKLGFAVIHVNSMDGIMRGNSALVLAKSGSAQEILLKNNVSQWFSFKKGPYGGYPESLMGVIALIRQTLLDAQWYGTSHAAFKKNSAQEMPEVNVSLAALSDALKNNSPVIFEAEGDVYAIDRAAKIANEASLKNIFYKGSGYEYQRLSNIAVLKPTLILPLNFPQTPDVGSPERALDISLAELMHWDAAPSNPYLLDSAGVQFAFTTSGLKDKGELFKNIRKAIERGLGPDDALAALTTVPAIICHAENLVGTLTKGKFANMILANGDIFKSETAIQSVFVAGEETEYQKSPLADIRGRWTVTPERFLPKMSINIGGKGTAPSGTIAIDSATMASFQKPNVERSPELKPRSIGRDEEAQTEDSLRISKPFSQSAFPQSGFNTPANLALSGSRLNFTVKGDTLGFPGVIRFSGMIDSNAARGTFFMPNGDTYTWTAIRDSAFKEPAPKKPDENTTVRNTPKIIYPFGPYGLEKAPEQRRVLLKNATVWTSAQAGILAETDVVISDGKITAIGRNLGNAPVDTVIDATGKHVTPGIIDEHSHIAIIGGVNEGSHANTAEVRIGDVLDPDDVNIYRQLTGGVTASHLLHGSANPVGGQLQFIKLRWGADADGLKFQNVDPTIKFALGENVKQSNWGDRNVTRYPQTRMGVEEIMRDGFRAALEYEKAFKNYSSLSDSAKQSSAPPRRDIQLETMLEIIRGKRLIHCHSYVQSEILMLMRVAEEFGFKVKTFTHILEGYKVASEMAKHGVSASTFADWWAYKFEVYDAIPQNAGIMHDEGVLVSINSDDAEMARRLNQEAAKSVKYSDMREEDALKMITINAARQMNVQDRTGSLEIGKDADIVVWSGHPLSNLSRVEHTFVDGRHYFSIEQDRKLRERDAKLRAALEQKALGAIAGGETPSRGPQRMMKRLEHCNDKEAEAFGIEHE